MLVSVCVCVEEKRFHEIAYLSIVDFFCVFWTTCCLHFLCADHFISHCITSWGVAVTLTLIKQSLPTVQGLTTVATVWHQYVLLLCENTYNILQQDSSMVQVQNLAKAMPCMVFGVFPPLHLYALLLFFALTFNVVLVLVFRCKYFILVYV